MRHYRKSQDFPLVNMDICTKFMAVHLTVGETFQTNVVNNWPTDIAILGAMPDIAKKPETFMQPEIPEQNGGKVKARPS